MLLGLLMSLSLILLANPLLSLWALFLLSTFLLSPCSLINLLGRDILCKLCCTIFCQLDSFYLDFPSTMEHPVLACLSSSSSEDSFLLPLSSLSDSALTAMQWDLLSKVPETLWSTHSNDVRCIHSAEPAHIQLDPTEPLPCILQYPISKEAQEGIHPVIGSHSQSMQYSYLTCSKEVYR